MPFGRKKADGDGDLDTKKASLFGRSKTPKTAGAGAGNGNPYAVPPSSNNPYAAASSSNPYAAQNGGQSDPYLSSNISEPRASTTSSLTLGSQAGAPPSYTSGGYGGQAAPNPREKSPVPPGGYGSQQQSRYQSSGNSYGQTGGYGSDPYGNAQSQPSRYGAGGYGGMGRSNSQDTMSTDAGRNALFGNAPQRVADRPAQETQPSNGDTSYSNSGGYASGDMPGGYGAGPARELTAEEQEEEEIQATKDMIRQTKQESLASSQRSKRIAYDTLNTLQGTLNRLGTQGEMIHSTERNLDMAHQHNRLAVEQAHELDKLTNSMFRPVGESRKKRTLKDNIALAQHQQERAQRDETQKFAYESQARAQRHERELRAGGGGGAMQMGKNKASLAERSKYQFEANESDDEVEQQLEDDQHELHFLAKQLNLGSKAIGEEIQSQNAHLDRLAKKADNVDDGIARNTRKLEYILKK